MTAVIYARYSSDNQREASIEGQLRDCKDYAEKAVSIWCLPWTFVLAEIHYIGGIFLLAGAVYLA